MKRHLVIPLAVAFLLLCSIGMAQGEEKMAMKIGYFDPAEDWEPLDLNIAVGVDFTVKEDEKSKILVSAHWANEESSEANVEVKGNLWNVLGTYLLKAPRREGAKTGLSYGAGVGWYQMKLEVAGVSASEDTLGFHVVAVYDITKRLKAEVKYGFAEKDNVKFDGLLVSVGYKVIAK